jgi:hypothetical protein
MEQAHHYQVFHIDVLCKSPEGIAYIGRPENMFGYRLRACSEELESAPRRALQHSRFEKKVCDVSHI